MRDIATDEAGWAGQDDGGSFKPEVVGTNDCFATSHPSLLLESLCCLAARQDVVERRTTPPQTRV